MSRNQHAVCLRIHGIARVVLFSTTNHDGAGQAVRELNGATCKRPSDIAQRLLSMRGGHDQRTGESTPLWAIGFETTPMQRPAYEIAFADGRCRVTPTDRHAQSRDTGSEPHGSA